MVAEKAIFAGSFDPPTFGHLNIIERASKIFGELHVVVAINSDKRCLFPEDERIALMQELVSPWENVSVHSWGGLVVEYAKKIGARILVRGVRNADDFSHEFDIAVINRSLNPGIETVLLPTDPAYFVLRSSVIKEIGNYGGDISSMVPEPVALALYKKYRA